MSIHNAQTKEIIEISQMFRVGPANKRSKTFWHHDSIWCVWHLDLGLCFLNCHIDKTEEWMN